MTTKERLHALVDELTEAEAAATLLITERSRDDAMLQALAGAPVDDEPSSSEEDSSAREALDSYHQGQAIDYERRRRAAAKRLANRFRQPDGLNYAALREASPRWLHG